MTPSERQELSDIMRELYASGRYRTSGEVLSEAWREFRRRRGVPESTQQRRYAQRKSFENPYYPKLGEIVSTPRGLGKVTAYDETNNRWLIQLATGGEMWFSPSKIRKISKNPSSTERQRLFMGAELGRRRAGKPTVTGMKTKELRKFARKQGQKNPIAIYNSPRGKIFYGQIESIAGIKTNGAHRGKGFVHYFNTQVQAIGLSDGSVLLRSPRRIRLWDYEENI